MTLLIRDRRAVEALAVASRLFEQATVLRWLADHQDELDEWFRQWRSASARDLVRVAEYDMETGRRPSGQENLAELQEKAKSFPGQTSWPGGDDWLHERAVEQGRQRVWWLWRLDRHIQWHEAVIEARFVETPSIGFQTRAQDLDDLAEVAAVAVESAITARTSVGSILGLAQPALLAVVSQETKHILSSIPRQS